MILLETAHRRRKGYSTRKIFLLFIRNLRAKLCSSMSTSVDISTPTGCGKYELISGQMDGAPEWHSAYCPDICRDIYNSAYSLRLLASSDAELPNLVRLPIIGRTMPRPHPDLPPSTAATQHIREYFPLRSARRTPVRNIGIVSNSDSPYHASA